MSASPHVFRFVQVELPWQLGPPDGRYLVRSGETADAAPSHVLVFATLGAVQRRRLAPRRRARDADPEPQPAAVATGRATVIDVGEPLDEPRARAWLIDAGEDELSAGLAVLNRALHAFRVVTADPYLHPVGRGQAIVARVGFGAGEEVADGLWSAAKELTLAEGRRPRSRILALRRAWPRSSGRASPRWPARSWRCEHDWISITDGRGGRAPADGGARRRPGRAGR